MHITCVVFGAVAGLPWPRAAAQDEARPPAPLPKILIAADGRTFQTADGKPFVPLGINYYRPGTGWAPQLWKKFDAEATRQDFARMKELGVNCVRVFLTYGSFFMERDGWIGRADQVRPVPGHGRTGGHLCPSDRPGPLGGDAGWQPQDRPATSSRWRRWRLLELFAERYRGRNVIFAYDLRNEPAVPWETTGMRGQWNAWLQTRYEAADESAQAWSVPADAIRWGDQSAPPKESLGSRQLLDYQHFREELADRWTRRQAAAIKAADPAALVTVGLIQWSVPALLPGVQQYSGFRPQRQAPLLDFLEVHFYPLAAGFYEYAPDDELGTLPTWRASFAKRRRAASRWWSPSSAGMAAAA